MSTKQTVMHLFPDLPSEKTDRLVVLCDEMEAMHNDLPKLSSRRIEEIGNEVTALVGKTDAVRLGLHFLKRRLDTRGSA